MGKMAWAGIFLSLVAFAYYLSALFILFGVSAFVLLASYQLKHISENSSQLDRQPANNQNRSQVFEYIERSKFSPTRFDRIRNNHAGVTMDSQLPEKPTGLVKVLRRRRCGPDANDPERPTRMQVANAALETLDEVAAPNPFATYRTTKFNDRHKDCSSAHCTHKTRRWEDLIDIRQCPNCWQLCYDILVCSGCDFMACPRLHVLPALCWLEFCFRKTQGRGM